MKQKKNAVNDGDQILIAEDSPTQAEQLQYILEKNHYSVITAKNGLSALKLIDEHRPSLVISDIVMPEMDGYEFCKRIKSNVLTMDIPVILLTSLTRMEDVLEGISCGADNFITKPYHEDYLIAHVEQILANKRLYKIEKVQVGVEIILGGKKRFITASQQQMLTLLLSTYEAAVQRNDELMQTQEELKVVNEHLEELVEERTKELSAEIEIRKSAEEGVTKLNRVYAVLSNINQAIVRIHDAQHLISDSCMIAVDEGKFQGAWIGIVHDGTTNFEYTATAGTENDLPFVSPDYNPIVTVLRTGKHSISNTFGADVGIDAQWKQKALKSGFRSFVIFPLSIDENVIGAFSIYSGEENYFDETEINLLDEMAIDISFALKFIHKEAEKKIIEESLQKREIQYKQLFDDDLTGDFIVTVDGTILLCNTAYAKMLGYKSVEELKNVNINMFYKTSEQRETLLNIIREKKRVDEYEQDLVRRDGKIISVIENVIGEFDANGELVRTKGYVFNNTDRKRAEEALQFEQNLLKALMDSTLDQIYFKDLQGRFIRMSKAQALKFGLPDSIVGEGKSDFDFFSNDHAQIAQENEQQIIRHGKPLIGIEEKETWPDGRETWVSTSKSPLVDADGHIIGTLGISRDITERKRALEVLRESELRFRSVWEKSTDGMRIIDEDGYVLLVNEAYCKMMEKPREEIEGNLMSVVYHESRKSEIIKKHQERFRTRTIPPYLERDLILWNGKKLSLELSNVFLEGPDQKTVSLSLIRDITERKRTEELQILFMTAFESAANGVTITAKDGSIVWVNSAFTRITGYTFDEVKGNNPRILKSGKQPAEFYKKLWETILSGNVWKGEMINKRKDGTEYLDEMTITPVRDENNDITHFVGIKQDVTERYNATEKIKEQSKLLNEASDAIIQYDLHHTIQFWNKSAERIYGWSAEEMLGKDIRETLYKDKREKYNSSFEILLKEGMHEREFDHLIKDGKKISVNKRLTVIVDDTGQPKGILCIDTDITEKKKLEMQFRRTQRLESIGTLAGGIAHDLNNVLGPILLSIEVLKRNASDEKNLKTLGMLEQSAKRGGEIVKQVLSFARGAEGDRAEIQIRHIINEIISIAKETFPKHITLNVDLPKNIWTILGDATQLHQVMMNLCVNARDAMTHEGVLSIIGENITIDKQYAKMTSLVKPGSYIKITVRDTGTGMSPDIRDRIFEPFFTTKEQGKGTGLGLSTVYTIVKSHGGFIDLESEVGNGSAFMIYLPATTSGKDTASRIDLESLPAGNGELILVVDDEEAIVQITTETLQTFGYNVLNASNGADAIVIFATKGKEISVVLTDMMMPHMDGAAAIRAMRKMSSDVKIIASSGVASEGYTKQEGIALADAFISKPYTAENLLKTIHRVLHGLSV